MFSAGETAVHDSRARLLTPSSYGARTAVICCLPITHRPSTNCSVVNCSPKYKWVSYQKTSVMAHSTTHSIFEKCWSYKVGRRVLGASQGCLQAAYSALARRSFERYILLGGGQLAARRGPGKRQEQSPQMQIATAPRKMQGFRKSRLIFVQGRCYFPTGPILSRR